MTQGDLDDVITAFATAAARAAELGFDGVELHGAHGYLIDEFLWRVTNARTDRYGETIRGRAQFAADIVAACRRRVGTALPIFFRFSQWKLQEYRARVAETPEELGLLLLPLVEAGVDVFDCSTRVFSAPAFEPSPLTLAEWTRTLTGRPVIAVGGIGHGGDFLNDPFDGECGGDGLNLCAAMVAADRIDLVAVGRGLLADPEWAVKVREGRDHEVRPFTRAALETLF
jgi:2,4-dienoyl-CoA reductase-like NADH-dependent reductase (Old Yellow Enzyme family)